MFFYNWGGSHTLNLEMCAFEAAYQTSEPLNLSATKHYIFLVFSLTQQKGFHIIRFIKRLSTGVDATYLYLYLYIYFYICMYYSLTPWILI